MEFVSDEGSSALERAAVSSVGVEDVGRMSAKHVCTSVSNHIPSASVTVASCCSENSVYTQPVRCQGSLSDSAATLSCSTDGTVSDVNGQSQLSAMDSCSVADVELNADCSAFDTDVNRRRHPRRCRQDSDNTACCPICKVTLRSGDFSSHVQLELDKLSKMSSRCRKPTVIESTSPRKKAYERVRNNRLARHRAREMRVEGSDNTTCPVCNEPINGSPDELNEHVEYCLSRVERTDENEDVDVDQSDDEFEEYEWAGQTRVRASSLMLRDAGAAASSAVTSTDDAVDLNIEDDDCVLYGDAQYTEADLLVSSDESMQDKNRFILRNAVISGEVNHTRSLQLSVPGKWSLNTADTLESGSSHETSTDDTTLKLYSSSPCSFSPETVIQSLKTKVLDLERQLKMTDVPRCLICMDMYTKPVTSIQCWHVHCEECWLRTLGTKKLCPQCNMITSASDLRRIYL